MTDHAFDACMDDLAAGDPYSADAPYVPLSGMGVTRAQYALQVYRALPTPPRESGRPPEPSAAHDMAAARKDGDAPAFTRHASTRPPFGGLCEPSVSAGSAALRSGGVRSQSLVETLNPASGVTRGS